jgi:hypothetical protein
VLPFWCAHKLLSVITNTRYRDKPHNWGVHDLSSGEDFTLKTFFPVRIQTMFTLKFLSGWTAPGSQTDRLVVAIRDLAQIRVEAEQ